MITPWIPTGATLVVVSVGLFFGRGLIRTAIEKAVQHGLDSRLEAFKSEIRREEEVQKAELASQAAQIDALRAGALNGLTQRDIALAQRRIIAVERLWAGYVALGSLRSAGQMFQPFKMDVLLERSEGNGTDARKLQSFADTMLKGFGVGEYKHDPDPDLQRPFVSDATWALFSVYRQLVVIPVFQMNTVKAGVGKDMILDPPIELINAVKTALPHQAEYLDTYGVAGLHWLIPQVENRLLASLRNDLSGTDASLLAVEQSSEILRHVNSVQAQMDGARAPHMPASMTKTGSPDVPSPSA